MHASVPEYKGDPAYISQGQFALGYTEQTQINDCWRTEVHSTEPAMGVASK